MSVKNNIDFIGVKLGAISKTTFTEALERKAIPNLPIAIQNQSFRKGDEVTMKLKLPKSDAFSFTFQVDPSILIFKTIAILIQPESIQASNILKQVFMRSYWLLKMVNATTLPDKLFQ